MIKQYSFLLEMAEIFKQPVVKLERLKDIMAYYLERRGRVLSMEEAERIYNRIDEYSNVFIIGRNLRKNRPVGLKQLKKITRIVPKWKRILG